MSKKRRLEILLLGIIGLEVLAAAALIVWAVFFRSETPVATAPKTTQQTTGSASSTAVPVVKLTAFAQGLTRPTSIASSDDPGDTRLFVTEGKGIIRIVSGDGKLASKPMLDISANVQDQGEMGLLGLALHPSFSAQRYIYVNYIDKSRNTIISRFSVGKDGIADPASERVLIKLAQPYSNHNGGQLAFGPDGYLYIGLGDGGSAGDPQNRAQNKGELFGKLLRIDVDKGNPYAVPANNPFAGEAGARGEIWAYGLRNPWRFSFDRSTGGLYIGDVGQGDYEEVDFQAAASKGGENYGWRCYEGAHEFNTDGCSAANTYVSPIVEYDHSDKRCSITGGYVYRGTDYPAMQGRYFYADLCGKQLYYATKKGDAWQTTLAASTGIQISTFGENSTGELFAADIENGALLRVTDSAQ